MDTIKAKPTTYRGVRFRSRAEARFAVALDSEGIAYEYEPKFEKLAKWTPDFIVKFPVCGGETFNVLVECKPALVTDEYFQNWKKQSTLALSEYSEIATCVLYICSWYPAYSLTKAFIRPRIESDKHTMINITRMFLMGISDALRGASHYRFDLEDGE